MAMIGEVESSGRNTEAISLRINTEKSAIWWRGTKMLRTAGHEGTLQIKEGYLLFMNDKLVGGKITADINTVSIGNSTSYDEETMQKLSNHLKRKEFNALQYPLAHFEITRVKYIGGDSLRVWGNMSIKGVTKNISIPAYIEKTDNNRKRFRTGFSLQRSHWNIGSDGNLLEKNLVDEDFTLRITLETAM
ncbi:YceI family protein [Pontibacter locisalis]|uniref:YceI family protein n=1 Tax=Pontibacter locisalis TaxID=1719035 RepID=A0ABW5INY3_9BACT